MAFQQTYEEALDRARNRPTKPRTPLKPGKKGLARTATRRENSLSGQQAQGNSVLRARKAKHKKRTKVPTRKYLVKKIDNLVFQIVCLLYAVCVECGSEDKPTTGHVLSRRSYATRWDFRNVFRQCWPCNYKAAMTAAASYHLWYVKTYGVEAFDQLYQDWTKGHKYTRLELQNLVPEFQDKLDSLQSKEN
jgi:hypothetical protein